MTLGPKHLRLAHTPSTLNVLCAEKINRCRRPEMFGTEIIKKLLIITGPKTLRLCRVPGVRVYQRTGNPLVASGGLRRQKPLRRHWPESFWSEIAAGLLIGFFIALLFWNLWAWGLASENGSPWLGSPNQVAVRVSPVEDEGVASWGKDFSLSVNCKSNNRAGDLN